MPELNSQFLLEVNSIFNDDSLTDVLGRKILDTFVVNPCEVHVDKAVTKLTRRRPKYKWSSPKTGSKMTPDIF